MRKQAVNITLKWHDCTDLAPNYQYFVSTLSDCVYNTIFNI